MNSEWNDIKQVACKLDLERNATSVETRTLLSSETQGNSKRIIASSTKLQKYFTYTLVGSISFAALLGIIGIFFNIWNEITARIIMTTFLAALFSLMGMICEATTKCLQKRETTLLDSDRAPNQLVKELFLVPKAGLFLSTVSAFLLVIPIWITFDSFLYWRISGVIFVYTVAAVHICLLSFATLPRRFEILFWIAVQIIIVVATVISVYCVVPDSTILEGFLGRIVSVLGICDLAITCVIPLLHRIGAAEAVEAAAAATRQSETPDLADIELQIVAAKQQLDRLLETTRATLQANQSSSTV